MRLLCRKQLWLNFSFTVSGEQRREVFHVGGYCSQSKIHRIDFLLVNVFVLFLRLLITLAGAVFIILQIEVYNLFDIGTELIKNSLAIFSPFPKFGDRVVYFVRVLSAVSDEVVLAAEFEASLQWHHVPLEDFWA